MAHRRCFSNQSDDINSGQYTSRLKSRILYSNQLFSYKMIEINKISNILI